MNASERRVMALSPSSAELLHLQSDLHHDTKAKQSTRTHSVAVQSDLTMADIDKMFRDLETLRPAVVPGGDNCATAEVSKVITYSIHGGASRPEQTAHPECKKSEGGRQQLMLQERDSESGTFVNSQSSSGSIPKKRRKLNDTHPSLVLETSTELNKPNKPDTDAPSDIAPTCGTQHLATEAAAAIAAPTSASSCCDETGNQSDWNSQAPPPSCGGQSTSSDDSFADAPLAVSTLHKKTRRAPKRKAPGSRAKAKKSTKKEEPLLRPEIQDTGCLVCRSDDRPDALLLCDRCNAEYHYMCVGLSEIPAGNWFCENCCKNNLDFIPQEVIDADLVKRMSAPADAKCGFCGELSAGPIDPLFGPFISGKQQQWVHARCVLWSAEVYQEGGLLHNVEPALKRGRQLRCTKCQRRGATIGCNYHSCTKTYHYDCAVAAGCCLDEGRMVVFCPTHKRFRHELLTEDSGKKRGRMVRSQSKKRTTKLKKIEQEARDADDGDAGDAAGSSSNLKALADQGETIQRRANSDLFGSILEGKLAEDDIAIIQQRVRHQQELFRRYEAAEKKRKIQEIQDVYPTVPEAGLAVALQICKGDESKAIEKLADPAFRASVTAAGAKHSPEAETSRTFADSSDTAEPTRKRSGSRSQKNSAAAEWQSESESDVGSGDDAGYTGAWEAVSRAERLKRRRSQRDESQQKNDSGGEEAEDDPHRTQPQAAQDDEAPLLPDFIDPITLEEVQTPTISPHGIVMSYSSWMACLRNSNACPLTKQLVRKEDLVVLSHQNIDYYRSRIHNHDR
eukprot:Rmarinus@m.24332